MSNGLLVPLSNFIGGQGISISGNVIAVESPVEVNTNKDQPNGYPGLDGSGNLNVVNIVPRVTTSITELQGFTPLSGELGSVDTIPGGLFVGDEHLEWHSVSLNSLGTIVVAPLGTPTENFVAFKDAMKLAATFTPNESVLSATNRARVIPLFGDYLVDNDVLFWASDIQDFVDISGLRGVEPQFLTSGSQVMSLGSKDIRLRNFRVTALDNANAPISLSGVHTGLLHENLWITVPAVTDTAMSWGVVPELAGSCTIQNVRTNGIRLYTGWTSATVIGSGVKFINCEGGVGSFGGHATDATVNAINSGIYRNCRYNGTGPESLWRVRFNGIMEYCTWLAGVADLDATIGLPTFRYCSIIPLASSKCIDASAPTLAKISSMNHKDFVSAGTIGSNVTNLINAVPASAGIIESNNF